MTNPLASRESSEPKPGRRHLSSKEVVPLLVTLTAGAICYGLFIKRGVGLPILGYNISTAERVMLGEFPYRDFLYNYTPGVLWLNAGLMKLMGTSLIAVNAGLFAFKLAALIALYVVASRVTNSKAALIPVALTLAWVGYRVVLRPYPTQYSMLFVLLGLICILNFDKSGKTRWLLLCGAAIGLVFVFKQNVGLLLLGSATTAVSLRGLLGPAPFINLRDRIIDTAKNASICWAGFALIVAALFIFIAWAGALGPMSDHFFSLAGEYGAKRAITLPPLRLLAPVTAGVLAVFVIAFLALRKAPRLFEPFVIAVLAVGATLLLIPGRLSAVKDSATATISYIPFLLLILVFATFCLGFKNDRHSAERRNTWWLRSGPILMVALFALGAYSEVYPRADYAHLVRTLPPIFLLLSLAAGQMVPVLTRYFQNFLPSARRAALLCAAAPLVFMCIVGIKDTWQPRFDSRFQFVDQTTLTIERARGMLVSRRQAAFIEDLTAAIDSNSSQDDYIFSFAPRVTAFYFLSSRRNPTRLVWWRSAGIKKADRDAVVEKIAQGIPKLVLIPEGFHNNEVLDQIASRYHQVGTVTDIRIYDRNQ
ncbi:MAG TPA: glycosyltransferase family 39 protein [Blastocatellia bacterium]|nr:glycosyltransferase family 39 protein [Blastocatellia bacterium]